MESVFGNSFSMISKSMEYLWQKQSVIAENIANNDTPGYKARYLTFESDFKRKLERASLSSSPQAMGEAIQSARTVVNHTDTESARLDGNNVQVESEYIEQARAVLQYQYQVRSLSSEINQLRTAIKG